jgi:protein TonB
MARRRGLEGVVTIEAKIDRNGRVEELRLFAGSGHSILDKAALKAVRAWQFSPGTVGGRTQSMWVKVPVRFELR